MSGKSLDQVWQEMQLQAEARRAEQQKLQMQQKAAEEARREAARQQYLKEIRMYEQASVAQNSISSSSAGGTVCLQYTTHTNSVWLYPETDVKNGLTGTTYSYTQNGNDLVFEDLTSLVQTYLAIVNSSLLSQPIGNQGYSLGVGTKLRNRKTKLNFVLTTGEVIVRWVLVEQITSQSALPVGGDSPDGTVGYVTVYTIWNSVGELPDPYMDLDLVNEGPCT